MDADYEIPLREMAFGAFVARARLHDCVRYDDAGIWRRYPWLHAHQHASGPWCWILEDVEPMEPLPWRGKQGLWEVDMLEVGQARLQQSQRLV